MKVLMVNKFYYPVGGPEVLILKLEDSLTKHGHEVIPFAMQHPDNWPSEWSDYFVRNVDYNKGRYSPVRMLGEAISIIYSVEARRKIGQLINDAKPDVAHLHNIYHQLSPSILLELRKAGIPTLLTVHDAKLMCPAEHFFVDGEVCELCTGRHFYHCLTHKCIKGSLTKSLVCTIEMYLHRMVRIYGRNVDLFIAPSEFYRQKLLETGRTTPDRIVTIHTSVDVDKITPGPPGTYALYLGRIDRHKGVLTLLEAMRRCPEVHLKMVGRGDAEPECERMIEEYGLKNVEMLGFRTGDELTQLIRDCGFLVTPSEWYENCPAVVIEAAAAAKPAIVTRIGGMQELVEAGRTGFIVAPKSVDELSGKISLLGTHPSLVREMGEAARKKAEREFSQEVIYEKTMGAYARAAELAARRR